MAQKYKQSIYQKTIKKKASLKGVGLHTGVNSTVTFKPAEENFGIRFKRVDIDGCPEILADIDHVIDISRGTSIGQEGFRIHTVEHILAAITGLQIDNILIELTEKEPPVMDGSAKPFVDVLLDAGIKEQKTKRKELVIDRPLSYIEPDRGVEIHILPAESFRITFTTDYGYPSLGVQSCSLYSLENNFINEFAPSRTFCFFSEIEELYSLGLIKGGSLDSALVFLDRDVKENELNKLKKIFKIDSKIFVSENGLLNGTKLRFSNEPVRHKTLDLLGDLALLGIPIRGHVIATKSGHAANVEFVKKIKSSYKKKIQNQYKMDSIDSFNIQSILKIMPHRYPFLLVDKILSVKPGEEVKAIKNVTFNEPFFQGHFPNQPIMPGVLILEAMAQTGGFLVLNSIPNPETKLMYFSGINNSRFKKTVVPGDQIFFKAKLDKFRMGTCKISAIAKVNDEVVCEAELLASVVDKEA